MNLISTQRPRRIWKGLWHLVTLCLRCCWTWPRRAPASGIRGLRSRGQLESLLAQFCPRLMAENICCSCVRMCKSYVSLSGQHQEVQQRVLLPKKRWKWLLVSGHFHLFFGSRLAAVCSGKPIGRPCTRKKRYSQIIYSGFSLLLEILNLPDPARLLSSTGITSIICMFIGCLWGDVWGPDANTMSLFRDGERISRQAAILHLRSYFLHFSPDSVMLFCKKFSSRLVQFMHVTCANQIRRSADMSSVATHEATTDPRDLERKTTLSNGSLSMFAWMCIFHFFVAHCLCMVLGTTFDCHESTTKDS